MVKDVTYGALLDVPWWKAPRCWKNKMVAGESPFDREYIPRPKRLLSRHKAGFGQLQDYKRNEINTDVKREKKGLYLSVNVFSTNVVIEDTTFLLETRPPLNVVIRATRRSSGVAVSRTKAVPVHLSVTLRP